MHLNQQQIDIYIGSRLKQIRKKRGLTQRKLAKIINYSYQQLQKQEAGTCKILSSQLLEFSKKLNIPIQYFFDDMPSHIKIHKKQNIKIDENLMNNIETKLLINAYYQIKPSYLRNQMLQLFKAINASNL